MNGRRLDSLIRKASERWVKVTKGPNRHARRAMLARAVRESRRERVYRVKAKCRDEDRVFFFVSTLPTLPGAWTDDNGTASVVSCTAHYARDLRTGRRMKPSYANRCAKHKEAT